MRQLTNSSTFIHAHDSYTRALHGLHFSFSTVDTISMTTDELKYSTLAGTPNISCLVLFGQIISQQSNVASSKYYPIFLGSITDLPLEDRHKPL